MFTYSAYGLGIHSEFDLPEFVPAEVEAEVLIHFSRNGHVPDETLEKPYYFRLDYEESILTIDSVGTFLILNGHEIIIVPAINMDIRLIRRYITGVIMSILLYQKGFLVLHASTANIKGEAIAFMGCAGMGKSSLAAALHTYGYKIISDDVSAIELVNKFAKVYPAFPRLKISVEAAQAVGLNIKSLIPIYMDNDCSFPLGEGFTKKPVKLSKIFVLKEDTENGIDRLQSQEALIELIRHSLPTRLGQPDTPEHFKMCVQLVKLVPIYQLRRSSKIQALPDLARMVEKIVNGNSGQ